MDNTTKPITWLQVNNVIPIVVSLIALVIAFSDLKADVKLLNQKTDIMISQQKELLDSMKILRAEQTSLALKQKELETRWNMWDSK